MRFSGRHWNELLRRAQEDAEPYAAAALYPHALPAHRACLLPRLFDARQDRLLLASAGCLAPAVLARLATLARDDAAVCLRLARNPAAPAQALVTLWRARRGERLRLLLARHANMPRGVLAQMAEGTAQVEILRALCENTGTAADVLAALERRHLPVLHRLLAINLATAADTLLSLWTAAVDEPAVRAQVLLHPHLPWPLAGGHARRPCWNGAARRGIRARRWRYCGNWLPMPTRPCGARPPPMPPCPRKRCRRCASMPMPACAARWRGGRTCRQEWPAGCRRTPIPGCAARWPATRLARRRSWRLPLRTLTCRSTARRRPASSLSRCRSLSGLAADPEDWVQAGVAYRDGLAPPLLAGSRAAPAWTCWRAWRAMPHIACAAFRGWRPTRVRTCAGR
ncbi:hypothetical protein ACU4GD_09495 [Cupriavidus basilensis]